MSTTTTTERPIIFTGESVRAILAGAKVQTRRVVKPQPTNRFVTWSSDDYRWYDADCVNPGKVIPEEYGEPGDRLWVRETFSLPPGESPSACTNRAASGILYSADADSYEDGRIRRPGIHMPRWASRLTLEVTGVRVERVQDISEADAAAEGRTSGWYQGTNRAGEPVESRQASARERFAESWDAINGKRPGCAWRDNPFVWALDFRVVPAGSEAR